MIAGYQNQLKPTLTEIILFLNSNENGFLIIVLSMTKYEIVHSF